MIIGFDTSSSDIYICILDGNKVLLNERYPDVPATEMLMEIIDKSLKKCNLKIGDIDIIAPGVGPGSFTGSRVAVATCKGLFMADREHKKILPFTSFDAIGYDSSDKNMYVIPGFSEFIYVAHGETKACVKKSDACDIAKEFKKVITNVKDIISVPNSKVCEYNIVDAIKRSYKKSAFVGVAELEPVYLRASQAEIELMKRRKINEG